MSEFDWLVSMIVLDRKIYQEAQDRIYSKTRSWDQEVISTHPFREAKRLRLLYAMLHNEETESLKKDLIEYETNIRIMMSRRMTWNAFSNVL